jgi:DNA-binding protein HU-beta
MAVAKTLTKTQLIEALAKRAAVDKKEAKAVLEALTDHVHAIVKKKGIVKLQDLGQFKVRQSKARMGRNPATGEPIKIKAKTVVKFYVGKALKDVVAKKK